MAWEVKEVKGVKEVKDDTIKKSSYFSSGSLVVKKKAVFKSFVFRSALATLDTSRTSQRAERAVTSFARVNLHKSIILGECDSHFLRIDIHNQFAFHISIH